MDKRFVEYLRFKNGSIRPDRMEEMWRDFAERLMEGKEIPQYEAMFFANCILDVCDTYKEKSGSTATIHSEIAMSLGLKHGSGRQFSDEYEEADIYQAIFDRMADGEPDKKTGERKTIGYKKAISKLLAEKHEALRVVQNTTPENIQRIYKKMDKIRKEYESLLNE